MTKEKKKALTQAEKSFLKNDQYNGLEMIGQDHANYSRYKKMLDDKYNTKVKRRFSAEETRELNSLGDAGRAARAVRQEAHIASLFTIETGPNLGAVETQEEKKGS
ncbi:hypothetical protein EB001_11880 [bacterium]|jgi:hypothetical protein|nr:hypothetical protein [bacterium]